MDVLLNRLLSDGVFGLFAPVRKYHNVHRRWNVVERWLLYGLCGFGCQIVFTAAFEVLTSGNRRLHGLTSIYAFAIYGLSALVQEYFYRGIKHTVAWYIRGLIYVAWNYVCEFASGMFLRLFDACPWDHEPMFDGHFLGVITAGYIPVWFCTSMAAELLLFRNADKLWWGPGGEQHPASRHPNNNSNNNNNNNNNNNTIKCSKIAEESIDHYCMIHPICVQRLKEEERLANESCNIKWD